MFELRNEIRELDFATDMKFDLLGLYEMSELTDAEKKLMATIIHTAENEEEAAEEVFYILNAPNAVNMDEECTGEIACKEEATESLNKKELEELFKLCDQLGIHTLSDLELFMKNEGKGKAILSALKDYLFFEIGDPNFQAQYESLKEDIDAEEWEEVAAKTVEDSDGFLTDYVWYTNRDKHVFIFGDSDIYRPEDGYFDWEVDIVEGKEAEAYKEAQDWFNSYSGFTEELQEAQDIYDIQGQAVRDAFRKEVLDEFKEIFTDEAGGINLDNEETLAIVRGYLEDMGYIVEVSETQNASHPIHIEWFK